ncbi:MAG TPA: hypothetical protein VNI34_02310 [Candidatus Nitrosotalea sp.]|nr:hypothetical protein [Candidatus Nitrosotalea sp.]
MPRAQSSAATGVAALVRQAKDLVARLIKENHDLRSENARLKRELESLTRSWDEVRRLTRAAARAPRRR